MQTAAKCPAAQWPICGVSSPRGCSPLWHLINPEGEEVHSLNVKLNLSGISSWGQTLNMISEKKKKIEKILPFIFVFSSFFLYFTYLLIFFLLILGKWYCIRKGNYYFWILDGSAWLKRINKTFQKTILLFSQSAFHI